MLRVDRLSSGYGKLPVVRDFSFAPQPGQITVLLGPNGAGKTTLLRTICGFIKPQSGDVECDGRSVAGLKPESISALGVRLVLEGHRIFPDLTVTDNIRLGQVAVPRSDRRPLAEALERSFEVFPVLAEKRELRASSLSGGQQQMLALAQAWTAEPKVLLCDEPSLGLAESLIPDILAFLRMLADGGTTVVLVEQMVKQALDVADSVSFMRQGELVVSGTPADFADAEYVGRLMVGGAVEAR